MGQTGHLAGYLTEFEEFKVGLRVTSLLGEGVLTTIQKRTETPGSSRFWHYATVSKDNGGFYTVPIGYLEVADAHET